MVMVAVTIVLSECVYARRICGPDENGFYIKCTFFVINSTFSLFLVLAPESIYKNLDRNINVNWRNKKRF